MVIVTDFIEYKVCFSVGLRGKTSGGVNKLHSVRSWSPNTQNIKRFISYSDQADT